MSAPEQSSEDVTLGKTGFNPYRTSHFASTRAVDEAGMSEAAAKNYLGAIKASLNSPNMVLDLRIPQDEANTSRTCSTRPSRSTLPVS